LAGVAPSWRFGRRGIVEKEMKSDESKPRGHVDADESLISMAWRRGSAGNGLRTKRSDRRIPRCTERGRETSQRKWIPYVHHDMTRWVRRGGEEKWKW